MIHKSNKNYRVPKNKSNKRYAKLFLQRKKILLMDGNSKSCLWMGKFSIMPKCPKLIYIFNAILTKTKAFHRAEQAELWNLYL